MKIVSIFLCVIMIGLFIGGALRAQTLHTTNENVWTTRAEAPPQDECRWMYDKALDSAIVAEKDTENVVNQNRGRHLFEFQSVYAIRAIMWADLYATCKTKNR